MPLVGGSAVEPATTLVDLAVEGRDVILHEVRLHEHRLKNTTLIQEEAETYQRWLPAQPPVAPLRFDASVLDRFLYAAGESPPLDAWLGDGDRRLQVSSSAPSEVRVQTSPVPALVFPVDAAAQRLVACEPVAMFHATGLVCLSPVSGASPSTLEVALGWLLGTVRIGIAVSAGAAAVSVQCDDAGAESAADLQGFVDGDLCTLSWTLRPAQLSVTVRCGAGGTATALPLDIPDSVSNRTAQALGPEDADCLPVFTLQAAYLHAVRYEASPADAPVNEDQLAQAVHAQWLGLV